MPPKQRRIAIMGYRSVGKSSLTIQFVENHFVDSYDPTIENTFQKMITIRGQEFALQLVDTAGQDEYSLPPQSYYVNIDGYVLVYSTNSQKSYAVVHLNDDIRENTLCKLYPNSFCYVRVAYRDRKHQMMVDFPLTSSCYLRHLTVVFEVVQFVYDRILDMKGTNTVPVVLVGNKSDLRMEREVSFEKGKELADSWKAPFLESSAKENQRVEEIFKSIISRIERSENTGQEKSGCVLS